MRILVYATTLSVTLWAHQALAQAPPEPSEVPTSGQTALPIASQSKRSPIKTLAPKRFFKQKRWEVGPQVGFVTNDPYLRRILFGATVGYHITELLAVEVRGSYVPDFGEGDWKGLAREVYDSANTRPAISKLLWTGLVNVQFAPLYGKIALKGRRILRFDFYGLVGFGAVGTHDVKELLDTSSAAKEAKVENTLNQAHFAATVGGGLRLMVSKTVAIRLEGTSLLHIETISADQLNLKNNILFQGGVTFFVPGMR